MSSIVPALMAWAAIIMSKSLRLCPGLAALDQKIFVLVLSDCVQQALPVVRFPG
jgi:hypothetical protein